MTYMTNTKLHNMNITRIHWLDRQIVRKQLDIMPTLHYVQNIFQKSGSVTFLPL